MVSHKTERSYLLTFWIDPSYIITHVQLQWFNNCEPLDNLVFISPGIFWDTEFLDLKIFGVCLIFLVNFLFTPICGITSSLSGPISLFHYCLTYIFLVDITLLIPMFWLEGSQLIFLL